VLAQPRVVGVRLTGSLPPWVEAKDVILELLRRRGVRGGRGRVFEFFGPGVAALPLADREFGKAIALTTRAAYHRLAGDAKAAAAFVDRWGGWDENLHGKVAANIRAQQRYRFRLFEYEALSASPS
jgi:homoaconitase/3-isopropylmalate dehydratase large subunit